VANEIGNYSSIVFSVFLDVLLALDEIEMACEWIVHLAMGEQDRVSRLRQPDRQPLPPSGITVPGTFAVLVARCS
jgi:hypothetical protein